MVIYLVAALVFVAALAGAYVQGRTDGGTSVRVEWQAAAAASVKAAADQAESERATARQAAATLQASLGKQRQLNGALQNALDRHIGALPAVPVGCPPAALSAELWDDWRRANRGPNEGDAGSGVSGTGKPATGAAGAKPASGDQESRGDR